MGTPLSGQWVGEEVIDETEAGPAARPILLGLLQGWKMGAQEESWKVKFSGRNSSRFYESHFPAAS